MDKSTSAKQEIQVIHGRESKITIDETDVKILKDLLENGRKSFSKIGKEAGVSQDIIWKHYKKLKDEGIIVGSTIQLEYASLGYNTVGSLLVTVAPDVQDAAIKTIKKIRNVYGVLKNNIEPKIPVVVTLKNLQELEYVTHTIKQIPGVLGVKTEVWIGIRNIVQNLSVLSPKQEKTNNPEKIKKNVIQKCEKNIDQVDKQIIKILDKNGRLSFRKIGQDLGMATDTISRRVKILCKNGVIKPIIQIDPSKLGYIARFAFNITFVSQDKLSTIVDRISEIPDITLILKTSGIYDLGVFGMVKNMEQLFSIQDEISKISGITDVKTTISKVKHKMPIHSEYISTF